MVRVGWGIGVGREEGERPMKGRSKEMFGEIGGRVSKVLAEVDSIGTSPKGIEVWRGGGGRSLPERLLA